MDDELRKKFLTEWQNRKKEVITHPYLREKVEWGMALCAGNAPCPIFTRRPGRISCFSLEMR